MRGRNRRKVVQLYDQTSGVGASLGTIGPFDTEPFDILTVYIFVTGAVTGVITSSMLPRNGNAVVLRTGTMPVTTVADINHSPQTLSPARWQIVHAGAAGSTCRIVVLGIRNERVR